MLLSFESSCVYRHLHSCWHFITWQILRYFLSTARTMKPHLAAIEQSDRFRLLRRDGATWFYTPNNDSWFICCINTAAVALVNRQRHFITRPHDELINNAARRHDAALLLCNQLTLLCKPQSSQTIINTRYVLTSCDDDVRRVLNLIPRTHISRIVKENRQRLWDLFRGAWRVQM